MGLDLKLLPFEAEGVVTFSHSILSCERRRDLFEEIMKLQAHPVPKDFSSYLGEACEDRCGHRHYGKTTKTPYGEPLTWLHARELYDFEDHEDVRDNPKNRAVWAYIKELMPDTKVAIYWS